MGQVAKITGEDFPPDFIASMATVFDIKQILRATCETYGFKHFLLAQIPHCENEALNISSIAITNNWPMELLGHYDVMGRTESEFIIKSGRKRLSPLFENIPFGDLSDEHADLLRSYNFERNAYFPVNDVDGLHLLVLTGNKNVTLAETDLANIQLFATRLIERALEIIPNGSTTESSISQRENEVLQWIAEGKTSAEIATIMNLSEHTVNHYAMLAVQKLECVNRTQAVVRSMRLGLIR